MWLFRMTKRWHARLAKERLVTKMFTRVSSFAELTKIVQTGHAAAVLPPRSSRFGSQALRAPLRSGAANQKACFDR